MRNSRSSAATYPAPNIAAARVSPKMCGTPNSASRTTVSPSVGE
jgi:hypothetical protein